MAPSYEFKSIPISNITLTDDWNLTPFLEFDSTSTSSASTFPAGYLHPPIVMECIKKSGSYTLICGKNRLQTIKNNFPEQTNITVLVLPADISDDNILLYLVNDKKVSGNFSDMEKSFFLHICCKNRSLENVSHQILPLLGEKPHTHIAKKLLNLSSLEHVIQKSIHAGQVSSKLAHELLSLSPNDRITLHNLFKQLELGISKQKRLYSLCKDLALRNNLDITTLLAENHYMAILTHSEMNVPQKGASLLSLLQKQLFPESTEAEKNFLKRVRLMALPDNCTVEHSPAFEGNEISVLIQFKNINKLEEQAFKIKEIVPN